MSLRVGSSLLARRGRDATPGNACAGTMAFSPKRDFVRFQGKKQRQSMPSPRVRCALVGLLLLAALLVLKVLKREDLRGNQPNQPQAETERGQEKGGLQPPPGFSTGCAGIAHRDCWAGVYVSTLTGEVVLLTPEGRVLQSPGSTSSRTRGQDILWWGAKERTLEVIAYNGHGFTLSKKGTFQHMSMPAATIEETELIFESVSGTTSNSTESGPEQAFSLVRDNAGFVFPGCLYILSLPAWTRYPGDPTTVRVILSDDGWIADVGGTNWKAAWSHGNGATTEMRGGQFLSLSLGRSHQGDQEGRVLTLYTPDGGRTWIESTPPGQGAGIGKPVAVLSLEAPANVTLFPASPPIEPLLKHLSGYDGAREEPVESGGRGDAGNNRGKTKVGGKLEEIVSVFEGQPLLLGRPAPGSLTRSGFLVVISRAVPRPKEKKEDLLCWFDGVGASAIWISWSMVLCR
ncbi:unnamed protein product [Choristocarpus tenellus]